MSGQLADSGLHLDLGELFYGGERRPVTGYLDELGWEVSARSRPELFAAYGRAFPDGEPGRALRDSLSITAIRKAAP